MSKWSFFCAVMVRRRRRRRWFKTAPGLASRGGFIWECWAGSGTSLLGQHKVELGMEKTLRSSVMRSLQEPSRALKEPSRALSTEAKMLNSVFSTLALFDKASGHVKIAPSIQDAP